jgi:hypothetical protein
MTKALGNRADVTFELVLERLWFALSALPLVSSQLPARNYAEVRRQVVFPARGRQCRRCSARAEPMAVAELRIWV